jgi:uncharacterized protein (TIGR03382 family)
MNYKALGAILGLALLGPAARASDVWALSLTPSSYISGAPGATIEWGYSITNQSSTDWLVLDGVNSDAFQHGTADASVFDLPIIAPGMTATGPLFDFTWDSNAPLGFENTGTFIVAAEWWDGDPFNGGNFIDFAVDGTADYTAQVSQATPEPVSALLMLPGLLAMVWLVRRRSRRGVLLDNPGGR